MNLEELLNSGENPSYSLPGITQTDLEDICSKLYHLSLRSIGSQIHYSAFDEQVFHSKQLSLLDYYLPDTDDLKLRSIYSIQEYLNVFQYEFGTVSNMRSVCRNLFML